MLPVALSPSAIYEYCILNTVHSSNQNVKNIVLWLLRYAKKKSCIFVQAGSRKCYPPPLPRTHLGNCLRPAYCLSYRAGILLSLTCLERVSHGVG